MAMSDAILVGEDWISEHYFTTDSTKESFQAKVLERRKQWDAAERDDLHTSRSRFITHRRELESHIAQLMAQLDHDADPTAKSTGLDGPGPDSAEEHDLRELVLRVLGYREGGWTRSTHGPVEAFAPPGVIEAPPLIVVAARPVSSIEDLLIRDADNLTTPFQVDDKTTITSVARLLSQRFVADDGPQFALVLAGRWLLVAEQARWAEGRYLAIDLQLVCERNQATRGGEIDKALTCVDAQSLAPDADGTLWWAGIFEESVKHTVGVSKDLREGVRTSIEIIANEVVDRRRAQGLDPLPKSEAQPLAKQALRFLYRILFLLYAEASPELGVLPVGAGEYEEGYGLDRLRELTLTELPTPRAKHGTHLYESLAVLFRLVDQGHSPSRESKPPERWLSERSESKPEAETSPERARNERPSTHSVRSGPVEGSAGLPDGLAFNSLRADLFRPAATAHIDEVKLGNEAVQKVLEKLLLSKVDRRQKGADRGFISYAELGINQLGAVYEGLMSYTGFFADEDLYEVAPNADASKGSWVVPVHRAEGIADKDFLTYEDDTTGEPRRVVYRRGQFVFRLSGRERQQSASYYSPEVITRFVVSQALAELLDQGGHTTTAEEILQLSICEPALGSGAFAIEAVRQLADEYLKRRQNELGTKIDPDQYPRELQRVKASVALHQTYGVDLNATAVELAEISLWLDTMVAGLEAPWFGLHLRRGNSLIGARHATYTRAQVNDKSWLKTPPTDAAVSDLATDVDLPRDRIHHFLLPAAGWGSAVEAKEARQLAPDAAADLKTWRRGITAKPAPKQLDLLAELTVRTQRLWALTLRRLQQADVEARRHIDLWGRDEQDRTPAVTREQIEQTLNNPDGAYQRLRRVMDAWCALWFWPLTDTGGVNPPGFAAWTLALQQLLGRDLDFRKRNQAQDALSSASTWLELDAAEELDLGFAQAKPVAEVLDLHPWLRVCEQIAAQQGFFHWELDFAPVFAAGGFDLQVGNPPWVRPIVDVDALLAEGDPWWQLALKPSEAARAHKREQTLDLPGVASQVIEGVTDVAVTADFVGSTVNYPMLGGLQPDLYRCFMERTWEHQTHGGITTLVHLESHFTDEGAGILRAETYARLRRHWQFINELTLYEIQHQKTYGVNVYGAPGDVSFLQATALYHPSTVEGSLRHRGDAGPEPGFKDDTGRWDLRPHPNRVQTITRETLAVWLEQLGRSNVPVAQVPMAYAVNRSVAEVQRQLSRAQRVSSLAPKFSSGWHETGDRQAGRFDLRWGAPNDWRSVILQGPHLYVANPSYKAPNHTVKNHLDWSPIDLEALNPDAIPVTSYKPAGNREVYDASYTTWDIGPARDFYRVAWRRMAANTGERTLIPALIPPGAAHVDGIFSAAADRAVDTTLMAGVMSSLLSDFSLRATPKNDIRAPQVQRLALPDERVHQQILLRTLRLNCLTDAYADLWREVFDPEMLNDSWAVAPRWANARPLADVGPEWTPSTPLRLAEERRQALVEIDALMALGLGVTAEQLCTIYRTQFAVLYGYDHNDYLYDRKGRLVPTAVRQLWKKKGDSMTLEERTATNESGHNYMYDLPFTFLDREANMTAAHRELVSCLLATPKSPKHISLSRSDREER